jgi:hypothetical protein
VLPRVPRPSSAWAGMFRRLENAGAETQGPSTSLRMTGFGRSPQKTPAQAELGRGTLGIGIASTMDIA